MGLKNAHAEGGAGASTDLDLPVNPFHSSEQIMHHARLAVLGLASLSVLVSGCGDDASTAPAPAPTTQAIGSHGITVLAPNGGETLRAGSSTTLKWTFDADSLTMARLLLSCNGTDWVDLTRGGSMSLEGRSGASAETTLVVPDSVYSRARTGNIPLSGSSCSFKIQDYNMTYNFDTSDTRFTIQAR